MFRQKQATARKLNLCNSVSNKDRLCTAENLHRIFPGKSACPVRRGRLENNFLLQWFRRGKRNLLAVWRRAGHFGAAHRNQRPDPPTECSIVSRGCAPGRKIPAENAGNFSNFSDFLPRAPRKINLEDKDNLEGGGVVFLLHNGSSSSFLFTRFSHRYFFSGAAGGKLRVGNVMMACEEGREGVDHRKENAGDEKLSNHSSLTSAVRRKERFLFLSGGKARRLLLHKDTHLEMVYFRAKSAGHGGTSWITYWRKKSLDIQNLLKIKNEKHFIINTFDEKNKNLF